MGYGIRINCVCPGWAETRMVSNELSKLEQADAQAMVERLTQHNSIQSSLFRHRKINLPLNSGNLSVLNGMKVEQ
jgi:NAD(P)-dependent dehydrogenase (short-subunit alcohol dehydrogenase family)